MSGLLHLVEAATALTHLPVGHANLAQTMQQQMPPSEAFRSPVPTGTAPPGTAAPETTLAQNKRVVTHTIGDHSISDGDDFISSTAAASTSTEMATLREKHLQALRAAAANAGLVTSSATPFAATTAYLPHMKLSDSVVTTPATAQGQAPYLQQTTANKFRRGDNKEAFPMRLHALLADPLVRDIISWLPQGKSFVILRPDVFATQVLPRHFAAEGSNSLNAKSAAVAVNDGTRQAKSKSHGVHKYTSFTRKLNRWGFRQISRGPDAGAFCHELFRRDEAALCKGMVCQKSRKSKKSLASSPDDLISISSASSMGTKSIASSEKRPYSSIVTVSTAGGTTNKCLPPKKRKSGKHITDSFMINDIPFMITHGNHKVPGSSSSVTESDLTSSDYGSVCSNNVVHRASPKTAVAAKSTDITVEAGAREVLARHFQEQHRAFALASLMENSRLALEAAGLNKTCLAPVAASVESAPQVSYLGSGTFSPPMLGAMTTHSQLVFAPTVSIPEEKLSNTVSTAKAAKSALYKAYLQALSSNAASHS